jgi:hypothetical protein
MKSQLQNLSTFFYIFESLLFARLWANSWDDSNLTMPCFQVTAIEPVAFQCSHDICHFERCHEWNFTKALENLIAFGCLEIRHRPVYNDLNSVSSFLDKDLLIYSLIMFAWLPHLAGNYVYYRNKLYDTESVVWDHPLLVSSTIVVRCIFLKWERKVKDKERQDVLGTNYSPISFETTHTAQKTTPPQLFYCCIYILCHCKIFTKPLRSNDRHTHIDKQTGGRDSWNAKLRCA